MVARKTEDGSVAVIGAIAHNGWVELVSLGARNAAAELLDRRRVKLVGEGLPSNPYHHEALEISLRDAEALIARVRQSVAQLTVSALESLQLRFGAVALILQDSPYHHLPDSVADVLDSWALTCAADGMMYREALAEAGSKLNLNVIRYPRKADEFQMAAEALGVAPDKVDALIREFGRSVGTPWRKDHRRATAAALSALVRITNVRV